MCLHVCQFAKGVYTRKVETDYGNELIRWSDYDMHNYEGQKLFMYKYSNK